MRKVCQCEEGDEVIIEPLHELQQKTCDFVLAKGLLNSQIDVSVFVACWTLTALVSNHCLKLLHFAAVTFVKYLL